MSDRPPRPELRDAAGLALVPFGVALVLGSLLAPVRPAPDGVPLPMPVARKVAEAAANDHDLADSARKHPLPGPVRALGSAIRDFHTLEAGDADTRALGTARRAVDDALIATRALPEGGTAPLEQLRALELEGFVEEVGRFQATGEESTELRALAGGFVRTMRAEGWCEGHTLAPRMPVLRVLFKEMWQRFLGLKDLEPTLDEQRLLYAFYLSHPHPSRAARENIASARRTARTKAACDALVAAERASTEAWRLERIGRLAAIDPAYPADYARGVVSFRRGDYRASATAFRSWLDVHPEGPFALRAQNYLRAAAAEADRVE